MEQHEHMALTLKLVEGALATPPIRAAEDTDAAFRRILAGEPDRSADRLAQREFMLRATLQGIRAMAEIEVREGSQAWVKAVEAIDTALDYMGDE